MQNTEEIKKRIITLLQNRGPCLPVQISREMRMDTLIISAFLSELIDSKKIIMSNLKVGGTHLYLLSGQEPMLENFQQYLHPKEQEALESLKKNRILKDSQQDPAIRVALRSIKDFSFSFKKDEDFYWRYLTVTEQEVKDILEPIKPEIKISQKEVKEEIKPEVKIELKEEIKESSEVKTSEKKDSNEKKREKIKKPEKDLTLPKFENPLALKPKEPKPQKIKPKSDFALKVIEFLEKNKFIIIEEKEYKTKEYNCISQIKTELGPIDFLTQAKDKKTISESDLDLLLRQAQTIPLPALMIYPENLNKKAIEYEKKYYSILKTKKLTL